MGSKKTILLDVVRGAAAIAVAVGHLRGILFVNASELTSPPNPLVRLLYFMAGFGHHAVVVFFVLSGYLVGGSVVKQVRGGVWNPKVYVVTRLSRLLTVLLPALVVGAFLDFSGMALFGNHGIYAGDARWGNLASTSMTTRSTFRIYLGNAFFGQNAFVPTAGSNYALWSLSNEFCYYALFLLGVLWFVPRFSIGRAFWLTLAAAGLCSVYRMQIASGFAIWLFGVGLLVVEERTRKIRSSGARMVISGSALAAVGFFVFTRVHPLPSQDTMNGVAVALALVPILMKDGEIPLRGLWIQLARWAKWLSESSYTLYANHLPFLIFLGSALTARGRLQPTLPNLAKFFALGAVTLTWARILYWIAERRTKEVRAFVLRLLRLEEKPPAAPHKKAA